MRVPLDRLVLAGKSISRALRRPAPVQRHSRSTVSTIQIIPSVSSLHSTLPDAGARAGARPPAHRRRERAGIPGSPCRLPEWPGARSRAGSASPQTIRGRDRQGRWRVNGVCRLPPGVERRGDTASRSTDLARPTAAHTHFMNSIAIKTASKIQPGISSRGHRKMPTRMSATGTAAMPIITRL